MSTNRSSPMRGLKAICCSCVEIFIKMSLFDVFLHRKQMTIYKRSSNILTSRDSQNYDGVFQGPTLAGRKVSVLLRFLVVMCSYGL